LRALEAGNSIAGGGRAFFSIAPDIILVDMETEEA